MERCGLGMFVDPTGVRTALMDRAGAVRHRHTLVLTTPPTPSSTADLLEHAARRALAAAAELGIEIGATCLAVPGQIDHGAGVVTSSPQLGWRDVAVSDLWRDRRLETPDLDGAGPCAARAFLAQLSGLERDRDRLVLLASSAGLSGAIVLGGRVRRGPRGRAGDLAHVVVDPDGPMCGCGSRGCLDSVAGLPAVLRAAGIRPDPSGDPVDSLIRRLTRGDTRATAAVRQAAMHLGSAAAMITRAVDLPAVTLVGRCTDVFDWMDRTMRAALQQGKDQPSRPVAELSPARLGDEAPVVGAALAAAGVPRER